MQRRGRERRPAQPVVPGARWDHGLLWLRLLLEISSRPPPASADSTLGAAELPSSLQFAVTFDRTVTEWGLRPWAATAPCWDSGLLAATAPWPTPGRKSP